MPDFVTRSCPSCGGSLQITDDIDKFACAHCGNEQIVKRGSGIVLLRPVVEVIKRVETGVDKTASELAINRLEKEIKIQEKMIAEVHARIDHSKELPTAAVSGLITLFTVAGGFEATQLGFILGFVVFILVFVAYGYFTKQNSKRADPYRQQIVAMKREIEKHKQIVSQ